MINNSDYIDNVLELGSAQKLIQGAIVCCNVDGTLETPLKYANLEQVKYLSNILKLGSVTELIRGGPSEINVDGTVETPTKPLLYTDI